MNIQFVISDISRYMYYQSIQFVISDICVEMSLLEFGVIDSGILWNATNYLAHNFGSGNCQVV